MSLWYLYVYMTPFPNGYVYFFNQFIQIFECWFISGLVKSGFERSLSEKKSQFLSKSGFVVAFGIYLCNLGTFWVLTNWRRCRGMKVNICPGINDRIWRKISVGKHEFLSVKKVVYLPWRLHCKTFFKS